MEIFIWKLAQWKLEEILKRLPEPNCAPTSSSSFAHVFLKLPIQRKLYSHKIAEITQLFSVYLQLRSFLAQAIQSQDSGDNQLFSVYLQLRSFLRSFFGCPISRSERPVMQVRQFRCDDSVLIASHIKMFRYLCVLLLSLQFLNKNWLIATSVF